MVFRVLEAEFIPFRNYRQLIEAWGKCAQTEVGFWKISLYLVFAMATAGKLKTGWPAVTNSLVRSVLKIIVN